MKRVTIIAAMVFAVFSLSAQHPSQSLKDMSESLSPVESQSLQDDFDVIQRQREANAKKAGPGAISQRMGHYEIARLQFGNLLNPVYTPIAPDSNYIQVFKAPDNINIHGFGQIIDPASVGFSVIGQPNFSENDSYTIDTIYLGIRYRTAHPASGFTGDTLRVTAFFGNETDNGVWNVGIGYPANTFPNQPARIDILTPKYAGNSAIGTPGNIASSNKMVFKYALRDMDTTVNFVKIVPSSPIQVPAGQKFGVFSDFIAGQPYDPATQQYYVSGGKGDVNNLSWLYYTAQNSTDDNPYFLEALQIGASSSGISHLLYSQTRYGSWTGANAFRNNYVAPTTLSGNIIDFWVSGNSTVGLDENIYETALNIYPNPASGVLNISIPEAGQYQLQLTSLTGQNVYGEELVVNSKADLSRDFTHLPKGVYLVHLLSNDQSSSAKLVLQ